MSLEEIKEILGIDLTEKNRKPHLVYLRGHYIDAEYKKGKTYLQICKELKCNHATAFHYTKRKDYYKQIPEYNEMKIVFDTGNVELFKEVDHRLNNINYIKYREVVIKKPKKIKDEIPKYKWHFSKIIDTLRKDNKNRLWDKPMIDFTVKDYEILKAL